MCVWGTGSHRAAVSGSLTRSHCRWRFEAQGCPARARRIPASTAHPSVARWCGAKPRLVLLNRVDMVAERDRDAWAAHFAAARQPVLWTDGASGLGVGQARHYFGGLAGSMLW